ncbi:aminotransferase class V-fold PLP-dependent enzyme, partial [Candidatus Saccharibacteria bacterium]|nr:aminotransferase class V-fold PLP-dependent enzyme [Candidatus Saccharibacteria bacterium]
MDKTLIYLDHAAATPVDTKVLDSMQPYFSDRFFNPSSPYAPAVEVRHDYENAKHKLAMMIGAKPGEITITAGATESINLALNVTGHIVTTSVEHHAVLAAADLHDNTKVSVDKYGRVSPDAIRSAIRPDTQLISVALANNELGTIQPIRDIAEVVKNERATRFSSGDTTPIYLHCDASQGANQLDVNVARLGVDMLTLNAGKIYGPKQVGMLWSASYVKINPQIVGGGQERGLRSGTFLRAGGALALAAAIWIAIKLALPPDDYIAPVLAQTLA